MLAYHLVFWNENALARLHGEKPKAPTTNDETFNDFDAAHWTDTVHRLDRVMKALETEVENMPEEKLAQGAPTISHIAPITRITPARSFACESYKALGILRMV